MADVGLFGEWDRFHPGHQRTLDVAFNNADTVLLAIVDNNGGGPEHWDIQDITTRKQKVQEYIVANGWGPKVEKVVEYTTYDDLAAKAYLEDFSVLIMPYKDQGRACINNYLGQVQASFITAGKPVPTIQWINNQNVGATNHAWSSSKLRRIIQRYYLTGEAHPYLHDLVKNHMPWVQEII